MHHIAGVANEVADVLSRTVYHNAFTLDSSVVRSLLHAFPNCCDIFGSAHFSYTHDFPLTPLSTRPRQLSDCPSHLLPLAVPPWGQIPNLLGTEVSRPWLLVVPLWTAQWWWPVLVGRAVELHCLPGTPWQHPRDRKHCHWGAVLARMGNWAGLPLPPWLTRLPNLL